MTKEFLQNNPDLLITKSDKGNITIAISWNQYNLKMLDILNDIDSFESNQNDPKTRKLEEIVSNIIKKSIICSKTSVKNSFSVLELIKDIRILPNYVLVSFDVIAMFRNIPLDRVKQSIKKRWDLIKNHSSIPMKQFIDAVDFIFHCMYLKFEGKFYK